MESGSFCGLNLWLPNAVTYLSHQKRTLACLLVGGFEANEQRVKWESYRNHENLHFGCQYLRLLGNISEIGAKNIFENLKPPPGLA